MAAPVRPSRPVARARVLCLAPLATLVLLAGCGGGSRSAAQAARERAETAPQRRSACPSTVLHTLGQIAKRVYHEGIHSERTRSAEKLIAGSRPLREAVEHNDPA